MKIMVTGANGQLGHDVIKVLDTREISNLPVDMDDFDITDKEAVFKAVNLYKPTAVIHCAAYTAVDNAENEPELCYAINEKGTFNIAQSCKAIGAKMMYISTDYVFDGKKNGLYLPNDTTNPLSVYGKSKLAGELAVKETLACYFIVRTSWVFGKNGNNFVKTMLRLGKEQKSVNVINDQFGSPTYTADLAILLYALIITEKYGVYHATNEGYCSWAEFAQEIMLLSENDCNVNLITTEQYPTKAIRPRNSRLSKDSLIKNGFSLLPPWKEALQQYLSCLKP